MNNRDRVFHWGLGFGNKLIPITRSLSALGYTCLLVYGNKGREGGWYSFKTAVGLQDPAWDWMLGQ